LNIDILEDNAVSPNLNRHAQGDVCAYAVPCRLKNGDLVCVYRQGSAKHSRDGVLIAQRSTDAGINWSDPVSVFEGLKESPPESVHSGVVCQAADGAVLAIFKTVEARNPEAYIFSEEGRQIPQRLYVSRSTDEGRTWPAPAEHKLIGAPRDTAVGTRPLLLSDGGLLIPVEATGQHGQQIILGVFSSDGGITLQPVITCAEDTTGQVGYGDARLTLLHDGRIVMLTWTYLNATEETIAVHGCVSADRGRTWTKPASTGVESQIMTPLALDAVNLIAASTVRTNPEGIRLWYSSNAGETWNTESVIQMWDPHEEKLKGTGLKLEHVTSKVAPEKIWESLPGFSFGTPDLVQLDENLCLLTYYATIEGVTHIRACRFKVEFGKESEPVKSVLGPAEDQGRVVSP